MSASPNKAREIFVAAVKLAPDLWDAYLGEACGSDEALRDRVRNLLVAHKEAGSFLEPAVAALAVTNEELVSERPGTAIGPYKLLQQIGEGGMGTVFMAEQTQPVHRKVALKVIKPGMDSRQVIARFEAERQALAMMDHVNIARVFDGGTTASGLPYFVMELVHGVPITKYCDDNHLTPRERLELFVPVCQAIQHAHQKGIIHRDLKPSNVMITLYDGKPVPKVIDFGVAKATEQKLTERTLFTQYGAMVGTLEYMSPEQAEISALGVDTRSDVYSLGVLLYELLTGSTPLDRKRMKEAAYAEIVRMIKEVEAPKPSTRLSDSGEALASISAHRHTEPAKLSKLMRGELDWLVMKALEKDRSRRYESASGFAADVQRYLADEPVLACPPSALYLFRKFARRNKRALASTSVVLLAVLLVTGAVGWAVRDQASRRAATVAQAEQTLGKSGAQYRQRKLPEALRLAHSALTLVEDGRGTPMAERRAQEWLRDLEMVARLEDYRPESGSVPKYAEIFREYGIDVKALTPEDAAARIAARPIRVDLVMALDHWVLHVRHPVPAGSPVSENGAALTARLDRIARLADPDPLRNQVRDALALCSLGAGHAVERKQGREIIQQLASSLDIAAIPIPTLVLMAGTAMAWEDRIAFYTRVQQQYPSDFRIAYSLGHNLQFYDSEDGTGDSDGAIRFLTAAVALRPDSAAARWSLGQALMKKSLGVAHYRAGHWKEAAKALAKNDRESPYPNQFFYPFVRAMTDWRLENRASARRWYDIAMVWLARTGSKDPVQIALRAEAAALLGLPEQLTADQQQAVKDYGKYLTLVIEADPEATWAYHMRAREYAAKMQWNKASTDTGKAIELLPSDDVLWMTHAIFLLRGGDTKGYRQACKDMLEKLGQPKHPLTAHRVAWACLLLPGAVSDQKLLTELAERSVAGAPGNPWCRITLGVALYRAGQPEQAVKNLQPYAGWPDYEIVSSLLLAMTHLRLRQNDEARRWLDKAVQRMDKEIAIEGIGPLRQPGEVHNWAACEVLRREAEELRRASISSNQAWALATHPDPMKRDPDRALELAKEAVALQPGDRQFWQTLAWAQYRADDWKAAAVAMEKVKELGSAGDGTEWFILAMTHWQLDDKDKARTWYDRAAQWMARNDPANGQLRSFRAEAHELLGIRDHLRFQGHSDEVRSVAYFPDGKRALSAGFDQTLRVWDLATGKQLSCWEGHTDRVWSVALSPDGSRALSGSSDATVRLWDTATGKELHRFQHGELRVSTVTFSFDGRRALSGGHDKTVRLWDVASGKELARFEGHADAVRSVAFSPDGRHALSGGFDKTVRLWDVATSKEIRRFEGHTHLVLSVAFSPDGRQALSGSCDHAVRLWDVESGKPLGCFAGHRANVESVAFTPDRRRAVSGSADGTIRLWDLKDGRELHCFGTMVVLGVAISPDGRQVLSAEADNSVRLWTLPDIKKDK